MSFRSIPQLRAKSVTRGASSKTIKPSQTFAWKKLLPFVYGAFLVLVGSGFYFAGDHLLSKPVSRVVINGEFKQVERSMLADEVKPFLESGFVLLDLEGIQSQLLMHPWVQDVDISRQWPDEIVIKVEEQTPIARWGEKSFMNHRGELFTPVSVKEKWVEPNLPQLQGEDAQAEEVITHFRQLNESLGQHGLVLARLTKNARGAWSAHLANDTSIVLGSGEVMEKMQRFLSVYRAALVQDFAKVKTIDMRYQNGFAVEWKKNCG